VYGHAYRSTPGIGHWNVEGHRAAGERIAAWLAASAAAGPRAAPMAGAGGSD
jgi:hypothetical protein